MLKKPINKGFYAYEKIFIYYKKTLLKSIFLILKSKNNLY